MSLTDTKLFPKLTSNQIERLKKYGEIRTFAPREALFAEGETASNMYVILSGRVKVTRKAGQDNITLAIHEAGDFTGEVSLISGEQNIATGRALRQTVALVIPTMNLGSAMIENPDIRSTVIPAMAARRPEADSQVLQREKLAALGKLSAGLAHELNNPASAASRAASQLSELVTQQMTEAVTLNGEYDPEIVDLLKHIIQYVRDNRRCDINALELSDREDTITNWLELHDFPNGWKLAGELASAGVTADDLEKLRKRISDEPRLLKMIQWISMTLTILSLVDQIEVSTTRMSELVGAIKTFTYMDQMPVQEVDVRLGLETTITILGHKLKNIKIKRDYDPKLPLVTGRGGDLNQVWANLIDNAVDAMDGRGQITIHTSCEHDQALVQITDSGTGISDDVLPHIFEPFFTTKGVGKGTGLGLDTVYRIVVDQHNGDIRVQSQPGVTSFEVRLPVVGNTCPEESVVASSDIKDEALALVS